ncbi:glycosyltransferase family 4 protein [Candidatus Nitrosotenuis uzonensis]|nr:glycosyltransferase family 4 protein [Candidatus Nitrosotenuis uzonensis]
MGKNFHVPNGVDLELFDPSRYSESEISELRKSIGAEKLVVFAGSLQDLNIIIDSAGMVIKKHPNVKYLIIGDHRDPKKSKQYWEEKARRVGLSENFIFLGRKPRSEIPKYILCADVCVDSFPNEPYYAAAHPLKLLEYGACGKPIVATKVSETTKSMQNGQFGYLADSQDLNPMQVV